MKKLFSVILLVVILTVCAVSFVACNTSNYVTLTFVTNGAEEIRPIKGKAGSKITPPENPVKEGTIFDGWYTNKDFSGETVQISDVLPKHNVKYYAHYVRGLWKYYEVTYDGKNNFMERVDNTVKSIRTLIEANDFTNVTVKKCFMDDDKLAIRIEMPYSEKAENFLNLTENGLTLEFKSENNPNAVNLLVGSEHLEAADVATDNNGNYILKLKFNETGTAKFAEITAEYLNRNIYIYIGGELYTQVIVNAVITNGIAFITNGAGYTYLEAQNMATLLQAGAFPVQIELVRTTSNQYPND